MILETANSLDESRAHLPEMQKSAKAARNGQSSSTSKEKRDFEEEGLPINSHRTGDS